MAESNLEVTPGSGLKLRTNTQSIGGATVHSEAVFIAETQEATYSIDSGSATIGASGAHLFQLMAGATLNVYVRRILLQQSTLAGAAATFSGAVQRLTTAGTGGGAVTAQKYDPAIAASGATGMRNPTATGSVGGTLATIIQAIAAAQPMQGGPSGANTWLWEANAARGIHPIKIAAGTANGIAIRSFGAIATVTVEVNIEFTEAAY